MDVPGYRIQRQIGEGACGRVYLALQHAFGRPVAIKVLTPQAAADSALRERFLAAARAARRLDHPNIVRVFDSDAYGDTVYMVMEYLRGGDLKENLRSGLHMQNVLMVVKDIATALDHAHRKGVVHGDVKPENILFNEQGSASLAGFGNVARPPVAWQADERAVRPAAGHSEQPLADGRDDLYDLGIVFYRMLTGRSPAAGDAPLHEPLLPPQQAAFQEPLRRLLARSVGERYASGAEIVAAMDALHASGRVPNAVVKTQAVRTDEIDAAMDAAPRRAARETAPASRLRRRVFPIAVLCVLLLASAGVASWYLATRPGGVERALAFAGLAEHPDVNAAWHEAEALRQDPNQSLAVVVAAYRRVLTHDALHVGAATAIDDAAERWKRDAVAALDAGDAGLAEAKLNELAGVFPADAALAALFDRLNDLRQGRRLLADTERLLARSGLSDVASVEVAIVTFEEVLRLIPGNREALAALDEIARHYGALAARDAEAQDVGGAMANFDRAVDANAEFEGVDQVRATISKAEALQAEINAMLRQAAELREAGALIDPPGANAADIYRRVLATKPEDALAVQGLAEVSAQVQAGFGELLAEGDLAAARDLLDRAAASGIGDAPVTEMQGRFEAELQRISTVRRLIAEAEGFLRDGYITGPSQQDNVVARLREAQRLDPDNVDVVRLLSVAATRLAEVAIDAYDAGLAEEGLPYLDLALTVTPGIGQWREMRERWQREIERTQAAQTARR